MISLDVNQIRQIIPQRYPMLMIDKIIELEPAKRVVAVKNVTINEQFFQGHFPDEPIMPGSLIIEAMAQTSTFLFYEPGKKHQKLNFFLGVVKDVRFFKSVGPGDVITIIAESVRLAEDTAYVKAKVMVADKKISEGELIFVRRQT